MDMDMDEHEWLDAANAPVLVALLPHQPEAQARALSKCSTGDDVIDMVVLHVRVDDKDHQRAIWQPEPRRTLRGRRSTLLQTTTLKLLCAQEYRIGLELLDVGETIVAIESFSIDSAQLRAAGTRDQLWLRVNYFRAGESSPRTLQTPLQVKYYGERETKRCCASCRVPRHMMSLSVLPPRIDEHWDQRIELTSASDAAAPAARAMDDGPQGLAARVRDRSAQCDRK